MAPAEARLASELARRDGDAFVHVGDRCDAAFAYCTDGAAVDRPAAFVLTSNRSVLCVPESLAADFSGDAVREFDPERRHPGQVAASVLTDDGVEGTVLAPPAIPHDAALFLEAAGYELASTDAVASARERKTQSELDRIERAQEIAAGGMDWAREILADAEPSDGELSWDGEALTADRLRREVDAAIAAAGGDPARNTRIGVGGPPVAPAVGEAVRLRPAATLTVAVAPREPGGYHGRLARTVVVDGNGGWERRAHVSVTSARRAALATLSDGAGTNAAAVREELGAELGAYGFDPTPGSGDVLAELGGGVGLERRELPQLPADRELPAGTALAIRPGLSDPERGHVETVDVLIVTDDGVRPLADHSLSLAPGG
jgi:Xaa-Pro aminopeptidase